MQVYEKIQLLRKKPQYRYDSLVIKIDYKNCFFKLFLKFLEF